MITRHFDMPMDNQADHGLKITTVKYTVLAKLHENRLSVDFRVYEIVGFREYHGSNRATEADKTFLYGAYDDIGIVGTFGIEEIDRAREYMSGFIKFDGCTQFDFGDRECDYPIHEDTRQGLINQGILLAKCWDWAKELIGKEWCEK